MGCLDASKPLAPIGTHDRPLRVAIVGSGPSGFYAAEAIARAPDLTAEIDMFERLPSPFGLVRGGVAPDHQKIKNVARLYERRARSDGFRFLGNVALGRDISVDDLRRHYDAIIYAVGGERSRRIDVTGGDLSGSHPAPVFVGWYNGHPDFSDARYDLSVTRAAVVGNGNVAIDVARILSRTPEELRPTDIADHAHEALSASRIEEVFVLGRRGPLQASFTPRELDELSTLADADVVVDPEELRLDHESRRDLRTAPAAARNNLARLTRFSRIGARAHRRALHFRFLVSPEAVVADANGAVCALRLRHNQLVRDARGELRPRPTDRVEELDVGMVIWAIGYRGSPLPGVPFDDDKGVIENVAGRVTERGRVRVGEYVVGWAGTGAQGLIGSHKRASAAIIALLLADLGAGTIRPRPLPPARDLDRLLERRAVRVVRFSDWKRLDAIETERGRRRGAPRSKLTSVEEMLTAIDDVARR